MNKRPTWKADETANDCARCKKEFTIIRRKVISKKRKKKKKRKKEDRKLTFMFSTIVAIVVMLYVAIARPKTFAFPS
jgi:uncharacterized membrane protein YvbJ